MAKKKSQKKITSSGENPFNLKVNRNKFSVLGQKIRGTRGLPGISRSLSNAKRKEQFHKKRIQSQKANKFIDKRFMDSSLSTEEQAAVRLVEERKKRFKKNIFNLNDEENLTHKGVPLENPKVLSDALNDSDDDEHLDPKFVKQTHFGGFTDGDSAPKSRKEIIDELIIESKKRKMERKIAKEKNEELIEQLDNKWKAMHHKLLPVMKGSQKQKIEFEKKDPFDVLINELKFEIRTAPPVREKTAEEIAEEEKEKQKRLEEERNKRMMNPMDCTEGKESQLSADSLYDGLDIQFEAFDDPESSAVNAEVNEIFDDDDNNDDDGGGEESGDESSKDSEDMNEISGDEMESSENDIAAINIDDSDFPDSVDKFSAIVAHHHTEELHLIIDSIIKDKIKSKSKQNIEKLETFFTVLLKYIMDLDCNTTKTLECLDNILPSLYTLAEVSPVNTAQKLLGFLDKEQELFQQSKGKKMKKDFPRCQCLVLFKIVSIIYSVSDFKHPIVTPTIIFMCDVLSSAYAVTFQNIYSRMFICKVIYDYVSFSKRLVPEVFWFLNKTLELAMQKNKKFNLFISEETVDQEELNFEKNDKSCNLPAKVAIISEVIELLHKFAVLYKHYQSFKEIFSLSMNILSKIVMMDTFQVYPYYLKEIIHNLDDFVKGIKSIYKPLVFENKKPVPLKLFEPAFECKFTRKKDDIQKKRKLIKSVNQKIRKEERGQLREIRRENQVIASEKLREKLEADDERKRKVRQLYAELAMQEGEYKKFMKKK